jgi:hypothetical protein
MPPGEEAGQAPNLREGQPGRECMTCEHYEMADRHCGLYDFSPKPFEVCDSFSSRSASENGPMRKAQEEGRQPGLEGPPEY